MQEKCKNCKYFVQHYSIDKKLIISKLDCGHCDTKEDVNRADECQNFKQGSVNKLTESYLSLTQYFLKVYYQNKDLLNELQRIAIEFDLNPR